MRVRAFLLLLFAFSLAGHSAHSATYDAVTVALTPFIEREMQDKELPALSIALIDDQKIVWSHAFGKAKPGSVYRAGSVSKLFTDIGIMQLVERGELELDVPVSRYIPGFRHAVTLRQLMSHRSGLTREPPLGHYFDATAPTLAATVESLNKTELVYPPSSRTKYSNAGIAVAGYVLERIKNEPFAKYLQREVLDRIGMPRSAFEPGPSVTPNLAKAYLWGYDRPAFLAPAWELGIAPAGSLYTTVDDLGRFVSLLLQGGGNVLRRETLDRMWQPQFAKPGETTGFGLGFRLSRFEGKRSVGHGGAIYGFATDLAVLPDEKLGVVAITTKDSANAVVSHISREALRLMLAVRAGKPLPPIASTEPVPEAEARRLEGRYGGGAMAFELTSRNDKLYMTPDAGGKRQELRKLGSALIADSALGYGIRVSLPPRAAAAKPAPMNPKWRGLIGEYGWDYNVLYVLEHRGRLTVLIEWYDYYPLTPVSGSVFRFPGWGLYDGESLTFRTDASGRATEARVGDVVFPRRQIGPESGNVFRIAPVWPVEELRREAAAAQPPAEPGKKRPMDLVEIVKIDPTIRLDIRYAGTDNFLSTPLYSEARALLQRPAAEALVRAHRQLAAQGYGLLIHDAYRPWRVTKLFWDATPADKHQFVADPSQGSRHNRGCAVDLTLYDRRTGKAVETVSVYDEMSERSYPDYPGGTDLQRWLRALLRHAMEEQGFRVFDVEWWHFDYEDWREYPIGNL